MAENEDSVIFYFTSNKLTIFDRLLEVSFRPSEVNKFDVIFLLIKRF